MKSLIVSRSPRSIVNKILARVCADLAVMGFGAEDIMYALNMGAKEYGKIVADLGKHGSLVDRIEELMKGHASDEEVVKTYSGGIKDLPSMLAELEKDIREDLDAGPKDDCTCPRCVARRAREAQGDSHQGEPRSDV